MHGVCHRLGKLGSRHAFQIQTLARNCAVLFDDQKRKLMGEVGALIGDLLVLAGQCAAGFCSVRAALLASGKSASGALDLAFGLPEESRIFGDNSSRVGSEPIKAHIDTDCCFTLNRRLGQISEIKFYDQADMPFASCAALECRALPGQINCLRLPDSDPSDFRNVD
jgi:hypothetical protein